MVHHHTKLGDGPAYYVVWRGALSRQPAGILRGSA